MKKLILFMSFLSISGVSTAQIWTGENPVWHYDYWNVGEQGLIKIQETGDTLIEGKNCQKLTAEKHRFTYSGTPPNQTIIYTVVPYGENYVYTSNDTVFYLQDDEFKVLFDFSATEEDSWVLFTGDAAFGCSDSSITHVDSVSTVSFGSETAVSLFLSYDSTNLAWQSGQYNSHFGAMDSYLFPQWRSCDMSPYDTDVITFTCFEDSEISYNPTDSDCEYLLIMLSAKENERLQFGVSPNPADEMLFIEADSGNYDFKILGLDGSLKKSGYLSGTSNEISVSEFNSGVYFVELSDGSSLNRKRFVKL